MDKITIGRGTEQLGQFTEEEVLAGLRSGQFVLTDLWWKNGMSAWEPLSAFPGAAVANAVSPLADEAADSVATIPWEDGSLGFFQRWWKTTVGIFIDPWKTFSRMPTSGGYGKPLLYALVGIVLISALNGLLRLPQIIVMVLGMSKENESTAQVVGMVVGAALAGFLCITLFYIATGVIGCFIGAGISHLCLMLFGAANRNYEATFRAATYTNGMVQAITATCVGCLLFPWLIVVQIIALKETHRTDYWRVICAWLLPQIVCCGIITAVLFAAFGIPAMAEGGGFSEIFEQIRNAAE